VLDDTEDTQIDNVDDEAAGKLADFANMELSRATTRFALDLRLLSPLAPKGIKRELSDEEKDARRALERCSLLCTTARNVAIRENVRRDGTALDTWLSEHGGAMPKRGELKYEAAYSYQLIRKVAPALASGIAATVGREVDRKWVGERFSVLHFQERSAPHYRVGQPFPIRAADARWTWDPAHGRAVVTVQLFSGSEPIQRFRLPIEARDEHQREVLRRLASGDWKAGEVKIERDRLRPAKWYLRVGYKRLVPRRVTGPCATVNRGMRCFLVAMIEGREGRRSDAGGVATADGGRIDAVHGETWIYDADDIEAYMQQMQRRRRMYQRGVKASNRVGHGRPRALRSIEHLAGVGERWRQTRCQVIARRLARWLAERGVSRVYLDDFTGIRDSVPESLSSKDPSRQRWIWERIQEWPYFQLGARLEACLAEYGIAVQKQETVGNSMHCPQCGYESADNRDLRNWRLVCRNPASRGGRGCGYSRHLDVALCANALLRSRGDATLRTTVNESAPLLSAPASDEGTARKRARKHLKRKEDGGTGRNG